MKDSFSYAIILNSYLLRYDEKTVEAYKSVDNTWINISDHNPSIWKTIQEDGLMTDKAKGEKWAHEFQKKMKKAS
jgi:hypothetical protein